MVLCVGTTPALQRSLTFDGFIVDEVNRTTQVKESAAGKGINVARVLNTLGKRVLTTGFVGGDSGRFVLAELDRQHIPHQFVEVPFPTRICTTVIDRKGQTITELVEESQPVEERYWHELERLIVGRLEAASAMVLSGGLPPNAPQDFFARCCHMAQPFGIPVIMDTRGEPLRLAVQYRPVLVKPNRAELASTFGFDVTTDAQLKDSVRRLSDLGAQNALITMGAKGAVLFDGVTFNLLSAPKVPLVNAIGSGDAVAAGFTAGLLDGLDVQDAAILGIACGSANAMTDTPGVLDPAEVQRLKGLVKVESF